ncbi:hypothetical protein RZS08_38460, partial [Arthrospira platensis SPKY1]|nr:hypothetical protein [Arthrospira platensis SPKY1]
MQPSAINSCHCRNFGYYSLIKSLSPMKKQFLTLLAMLLFALPFAFGQEEGNTEVPKLDKKEDLFFSSSGEVIFSFADLDVFSGDQGNVMRFS